LYSFEINTLKNKSIPRKLRIPELPYISKYLYDSLPLYQYVSGGIILNITFLTLIFYLKRITILTVIKLGYKNHFHRKYSYLKHERKSHVYLIKTNITNLTQNITPG
jgi:hypothetical protein